MANPVSERKVSVIALVGLLLAVVCPAMGQADYTWNNPITGQFGQSGNWTPAGPPGPADRAIFAAGWSTEAYFAATHTNDRLLVNNTGVTLSLEGNTYSLTHTMDADASVMIGADAGTAAGGDLTVRGGPTVAGGAVLSAELWIGQDFDDWGSLTVCDGASWSTSRFAHFTVGSAGSGLLDVASGGQFTFDYGIAGFYPGGWGSIDVHGGGSTFSVTSSGGLTLGLDGTGQLSVYDGGYADTAVCWLASHADSMGTASVDGWGSVWDLTITGQEALTVGQGGHGSVRVTGGGAIVAADTILLGAAGGATGEMYVSDTGSTVTTDGFLILGQNGGAGHVWIDDGGWVTAQKDCHIGFGGQGSITVSGGSALLLDGWGGLFVGGGGDGELTILDGGVVRNAGNGHLAQNPGSSGDARVEGDGSVWQVGWGLYVGGGMVDPGDEAELEVLSGGRVVVSGELKVYGQGEVFVDGGDIHADTGRFEPGARVTVREGEIEFDGQLSNAGGVRAYDDGLLRADSLSTGTTGWMLIGGYESVVVSGTTDNAGRIELTGAAASLRSDGPFTNNGLITGDGEIEAELTNAAGGEMAVTPGRQLKLSGTVTNTGGQITLGGGAVWCTRTLTHAGGLIVGNGLLRADGGLTNEATIALSGQANVVGDVDNAPAGLIRVTGGGPTTFFDDVNNDGEIRVSTGSMATYFGEVTGSGTFTGGGTNYFEGDLKPGHSAAVMVFEGDVVLTPWASLEAEIGGASAGEYDQVQVGGRATLDGALDVVLIGGYLPLPYESFAVVTCGSRDGQFATVTGLDDLGGHVGLDFVLSYEPTGVVLTAWAVSGDADLDGKVNVYDLAILANNYNTGGGKSWLEADYTGDGEVNVYDLAELANHYGHGAGGSTGLTTGGEPVPEPATAALLAMGLAVGAARRRPAGRLG